ACDVRSDRASVEAEPDDGREHEPDRDETEPPELGMVVPACLPRLLADARGTARLARPRRYGPLLPRPWACCFCGADASPARILAPCPSHSASRSVERSARSRATAS